MIIKILISNQKKHIRESNKLKVLRLISALNFGENNGLYCEKR
jgi:hypothetical protein